MSEPKYPQLPFLTREMLTFGNQAAIDMEVVAYGSDTGLIQIIGTTREGIFKFPFNHTGDGSEDTAVFGLPDFPIVLTAFTDVVSFDRGDLWMAIYLRINGERIQKLCSGYISKQSAINFPIAQSELEVPAGGSHKRINIPNPAAGAEAWGLSTLNEHWIVKGVTFVLTTDANAANRYAHFKCQPYANNTYFDCISSVAQVASTARTYHFAPYGNILRAEDDNDILVNMPPDIRILNSQGFGTDITDIQAGDQISGFYMWVESFFQD